MSKKFIEIVTEYYASCTYPEYEGKPYFSILYEENGKKFYGFGTYNPKVLSEYIREYFIKAEKGEWEEKEVFDTPAIEQWQHARCSACGRYHTTPFSYCFTNYKYCPMCGAAMTREEAKQ